MDGQMQSQHPPQQQEFLPSFNMTDFMRHSSDSDTNVQGHHQEMFNNNNGMQPTTPTATGSQQPPMAALYPPSANTLEALQGFLANNAANPSQATTPQMLLEQQLRLQQLQQLQQLQNQIFQQQMELISAGQASITSPDTFGPSQQRRDQQQFHGLPTPVSSTDLSPQVNGDFMSPMMLQYGDNLQPSMNEMPHSSSANQSSHSSMSHVQSSPVFPPYTSTSAPANIVFHTHTPMPLPSPAAIDYDLSPLTSPWLEAQHQSTSYTPRNKRNASSSGDDTAEQHVRKRPPPALPNTNNTTSPHMAPGSRPKKGSRGSGIVSASSTPYMNSTHGRERKGSISIGVADEVPNDTPSPVDLSMPPPAAPGSGSNALTASSSSMSASTSSSGLGPSTSYNGVNIAPVTPASIMNLGRLGLASGLSPPMSGSNGLPQKERPKGKTPIRPKVATAVNASVKSKRSPGVMLVSPNLKPLLPAGPSSLISISPTTLISQPTLAVRKTCHKAAEQKRRDSLKTSFDDLRLLLPPIPLPSEEGYNDEPLLPGAMPPRGPPKGDSDGPNRGVSKLQLLRCGNDFIRQLKGRVGRRDAEIETLRREVRRLRLVAGETAVTEGEEEELDLERDLDAVEIGSAPLGRASVISMDGDDADGEAGD